ncbi:MAG: helical backbone metal receptor [Gemmatimonadota bacterium]|nr:helical backbone metal receptor [Gemmatimonadota bacterium]
MRLVSLCPSLTELLFDLGVGGSLVGRTKFCVHPRGEVDRVEKVGGTKDPRVERIVALKPDLVLLNEEENRREDAEALVAAGVSCHVSLPRNTADTADMVRSIGAAVGRAPDAEKIAREIEARSARVRRAAADEPPLRFAYLIWREPLMTLNADTFVSSLLCQPGGRNVFADEPDRYPVIDAARLAAAAPQVVMLSSEPFPFRGHHAADLAHLTGLPAERFRLVDGELLSWHGSRTPAGIDYAETLIREARAGSGR